VRQKVLVKMRGLCGLVAIAVLDSICSYSAIYFGMVMLSRVTYIMSKI
jgi:hypothetical protein